jgi:hypothetical protein
MIEQAVFVTTDLFEVTAPAEHFINARRFGEDFAAWLRARLIAAGNETSEPIKENWGWVLLIKQEKRTFTVALGVMDESIGVVPAEWYVGLAYEKLINGIRGWLQPAPIDLFSNVFGQLRAVLSSEPRFCVSDAESGSGPPDESKAT